MASTLYLILPILFILIISTIPVTCTSYDSETIHGALAKITPNSWSAFHSLEFPAPLDKSYCGASHLIPSLQTQSDLELVQVQVITRHGDRVPVNLLGPFTYPQNVVWDCTMGVVERSTLFNATSGVSRDGWNDRRVYRKNYIPKREMLRGNCAYGQLTAKGFRQHEELGQSLGRAYDNILITTSAPPQEQVYVRSTDSYRTFQSAEGNLHGMFPNVSSTGVDLIDIYTVDSKLENMYGNSYLCPKGATMRAEKKESKEFKLFEAITLPIREEIARLGYYNGDIDQVDLGAFCDVCNAQRCHDFEFPDGVTEELFASAWAANQWENGYLYSDPSTAPWDIGSFLKELLERMENPHLPPSHRREVRQPKLLLYSGHDSTFFPLLGLMGIFTGEYPPYASNMELELWKDKKTGEQLVRTIYNGEEQNPYNCVSNPGQGPILCPLPQFISYSEKYVPPKNFFSACRS